MPALDALPILPHPFFGGFSLLDLAKIFGVPVALFLLARFITRRDKLRDEALAEETRALKARNDTADNERQALRAESDKNKAEHERFQQALQEMRAATQGIQNDVQTLKLEVSRVGIHNEGFRETLGRVDSQLGRLIDNYRKLS